MRRSIARVLLYLIIFCLIYPSSLFAEDSVAPSGEVPVPPVRPPGLWKRSACNEHIRRSQNISGVCAPDAPLVRKGMLLCAGSVKLEEDLRQKKDIYSKKVGEILATRTEADIESMRGSLQKVGIVGLERDQTALLGEYHNLRIMREGLDKARRALGTQARAYVTFHRDISPKSPEMLNCARGEQEGKILAMVNHIKEFSLKLRSEIATRQGRLYELYTAPIVQKMAELEAVMDKYPELKATRIRYKENLATLSYSSGQNDKPLNDRDMAAVTRDYMGQFRGTIDDGPDLSLTSGLEINASDVSAFSWADYDNEGPNLFLDTGLVFGPGTTSVSEATKDLTMPEWSFVPDPDDRIVFSDAPTVAETEKVVEQMLLETFNGKVVVDEATGLRTIGGWTDKQINELAVGLVAAHERGLMSTDMALANLYRESAMKPGRYDSIGHGESYGLFQLNLDNAKYLDGVASAYNIEYPPGLPFHLRKLDPNAANYSALLEERVKWGIDNSVAFQAQLSSATFNDSMHLMRARMKGEYVPPVFSDYVDPRKGYGTGFPLDVRGDGNEILGVVHYVGGPAIAPTSTGTALMLMAEGYDVDDFIVPLFNKACKDYPGRPGVSQCGEPVHLVSCFRDRIAANYTSGRTVSEVSTLGLEECRKTYSGANIHMSKFPIGQ